MVPVMAGGWLVLAGWYWLAGPGWLDSQRCRKRSSICPPARVFHWSADDRRRVQKPLFRLRADLRCPPVALPQRRRPSPHGSPHGSLAEHGRWRVDFFKANRPDLVFQVGKNSVVELGKVSSIRSRLDGDFIEFAIRLGLLGFLVYWCFVLVR